MKIWHPLKLTSLCFICVDISLLLGGIVYADPWVGFGGVLGMMGNVMLLVGGSGEKRIGSIWLRNAAPYAERLSMILYSLMNLCIVVAGLVPQHGIVYSEIWAGGIGFTGCLAALFWRRGQRLTPYQMTGIIWMISGMLYIFAGMNSGNIGILIGGFFSVLGNLFTMLSRRAEFRANNAA